ITGWESSTDNFSTSTTIANVTASQSYLNLTATTKYRAIIKSGTCSSVTSAAETITVDPVSVGGTVSADATVCSGSNSGTLTLSGYTGSITGWEKSTNNFSSKTAIANVTASQSYLNVTATTKYRAIIKSGTCSSVTSAEATITVDPVSVGGTVSANTTVCSGSNSGTLTLSGYTGSITGWESSTDNFSTSTTIANVTASQSYLNLTATTKYRAIIKSGTCSSVTSAAATITVDPVSVGGTVSSDATVCSGSNSGTLTLSGYTGTITGWEKSTNNFSSKTAIANVTASQSYLNVTATTKYRAIIKSGTCSSVTSAEATIAVDPVSIGGTVSANTTVCSGSNSGTLTLSGYTGAITGWEKSTNNFSSKTAIANVTASQPYLNLTATTKYRAIIKSGTCSSVTSAEATITVDPVSVGGTVSSDATVCSGSNSGTLILSGYTGTITGWESSTDDFVNNITSIADVTASHSYLNLTATTKYRAIIKSGTCSSVNSAAATITVDPVSVGGIVSTDSTVCSGANSGTLSLSGYTGSITGWESSIDDFSTNINIANVTASQSYLNLTVTTKYRAIIKSGTCPSINSVAATITVDSLSIGGVVSSDTTVCSGSNVGVLQLTSYRGTVIGWEMSTDNFTNSEKISELSDSLLFKNVVESKRYRAIVQSGVCAPKTSTSVLIKVDSVTVPGVVSADDTVCSGANSGKLVLSGFTGKIRNWQSSINDFSTSTSIANKTNTLDFSNITVKTSFRAVVKSGMCPSKTSIGATITVDPTSVGGVVSVDATVCSGSNAGMLQLSGSVGTVLGWQSSTNDFVAVNNISNTTLINSFSGLTATTKYRAIVKSGTCAEDTSSFATITVDSITVGGIVSADTTVCSGSNAGSITLGGFTGTITGWESSTDDFANDITPISNVTAIQSYLNLTSTTKYRALIKSGVCSSAQSTAVTITVDSVSVGGTVSADATVCSGSNSGVLTLAGYTGTITRWEKSNDGFTLNIDTLLNGFASESFNGLTASTQYRAIVKSGVCPSVNSSSAKITVDPLSVGGILSSDEMVCKGVNSDTLSLSGYTGTISRWESSTDDFVTDIQPISNTTYLLAYQNVSVPTKYRAVVQSGVCSSVNSSEVLLSIDPIAVSINDQSICEGSVAQFKVGPAYKKYQWSGMSAGNDSILTATKAGMYYIDVFSDLGCVASDSAILSINSFPKSELGADTSMCDGQNVVLNPQTANNLKYEWLPGLEKTKTISVSKTGKYSVKVSDAIGCSRSDSVFVQVHNLPQATLGNDTTMCENGYDRLTLQLHYNGTKQLLWSTGAANVDSVIVGGIGSYWVEVSDSNKCSIRESIEVSQFCNDVFLEWPNVITPNGDGINEQFQPKNINDDNFQQIKANVNSIELVMYDRWGIEVFHASGVIPFWDATFNGVIVASGTYYWVVNYSTTAGKSHEHSGYLTVLY
ncbi:MAG: gliding motility-associated C-terminal domain-containing protein, partial [Bacteroidetes bacterium]|nr:gliding motility-associated C-terminal domain-containing protein [Bacteroidota bacterium]